MKQALYTYEKKFWAEGKQRIAGVDEVGRGPLAGPVVAAAVVLPREHRIRGLNDSKQLPAARRESLFAQILEYCQVGVGLVSEKVIDQINIYQASREAMRQAVSNLPAPPDALLIDGRMNLDLGFSRLEIIHGDALSASIAAASIVAKVIRDRIMLAYHEIEPNFSFKTHKGYATDAHLQALAAWGPSPFHRQSFRPVKKDAEEVLQ